MPWGGTRAAPNSFGGVEMRDADLLDHLKRYGYEKRHGRIVEIRVAHNLLRQPIFREVYFEDGFYCTFCKGATGKWVRHRGGGRYGRREMYEGCRSEEL